MRPVRGFRARAKTISLRGNCLTTWIFSGLGAYIVGASFGWNFPTSYVVSGSGIPDSRFQIPDSRFQIPDSKFQIPNSRMMFMKAAFGIGNVESGILSAAGSHGFWLHYARTSW